MRPAARATVAVTARTRRADRAVRCERIRISIDLPVTFCRRDIANARAEAVPERSSDCPDSVSPKERCVTVVERPKVPLDPTRRWMSGEDDQDVSELFPQLGP